MMSHENVRPGDPAPAEGPRKKSAGWLWAVLGAAVLMSVVWTRPLPDASARIAAFPDAGWFYTSRALELSPAEQRYFGRAKVTRRLVHIRGLDLLMSVVDGTGDRHAVHDPLYCFRGAGQTILRETALPTSRGQAGEVTMTGPAAARTALYWFTDGTRHFLSPWQYWVRTAWRRLTLGRSGPEPLLVLLVPLDSGKSVDWAGLLEYWPEITRL